MAPYSCTLCGCPTAAVGWRIISTVRRAGGDIQESDHGPGDITFYNQADEALAELKVVMDQWVSDGLGSYTEFGHVIEPVPYCGCAD